MFKVLVVVVVLCLCQDTIAYCCFRDAWTLPCGNCPDIDICGALSCNPCNACCAVPPCLLDTSNVCIVDPEPLPICSCLKSLPISNCGCKNNCGCEKTFIYFPEVEYPTAVVDIMPFYYSSC